MGIVVGGGGGCRRRRFQLGVFVAKGAADKSGFIASNALEGDNVGSRNEVVPVNRFFAATTNGAGKVTETTAGIAYRLRSNSLIASQDPSQVARFVQLFHNVSVTEELTFNKDLGNEDGITLDALFELLLHLAVHGHVPFFISDKQRAQNTLHLQAALERFTHDTHRCRVDDDLSVLPLCITFECFGLKEGGDSSTNAVTDPSDCAALVASDCVALFNAEDVFESDET